MAREEGTHRRAIALVDAHAQLVVFDVGREFMVADLARGTIEPVAVAGAECVTRRKKDTVAVLRE